MDVDDALDAIFDGWAEQKPNQDKPSDAGIHSPDSIRVQLAQSMIALALGVSCLRDNMRTAKWVAAMDALLELATSQSRDLELLHRVHQVRKFLLTQKRTLRRKLKAADRDALDHALQHLGNLTKESAPDDLAPLLLALNHTRSLSPADIQRVMGANVHSAIQVSRARLNELMTVCGISQEQATALKQEIDRQLDAQKTECNDP